ncbi:MAG: DUF4333 domain-containing protein [Actinomycetota bacterium]|nr:DUF4333 domain-containing protein [Actinomycetota bacterium]
MPRLRTFAVLACSALALAGCAKTLESGDAESKIADEIKKQRNVEVKVECPDDMEAKKGKRYQCTVTEPSGAQLGLTLETTDDDGGFRFEVDDKPKSP